MSNGQTITKQDLDQAITTLRFELRDDFHREMINQVRWYATIIIVQFFAVVAAVGFLDRLTAPN
jgi:hypothetical protein